MLHDLQKEPQSHLVQTTGIDHIAVFVDGGDCLIRPLDNWESHLIGPDFPGCNFLPAQAELSEAHCFQAV